MTITGAQAIEQLAEDGFDVELILDGIDSLAAAGFHAAQPDDGTETLLDVDDFATLLRQLHLWTIEAAAAEHERAEQLASEARKRLHNAFHGARAAGIRVTEIADTAALSRQMVHRVLR